MTRQVDTQPEFSIASLTKAQRDRLARIPDEEQRSVVYRELVEDSGCVPPWDFSVAENSLVYSTLAKYPTPAESVLSPPHPLPWRYTRYLSPYGSDSLRRLMAERLSKSFNAPVCPEDLFGTAGVSSALELIALGLQLPLGDGKEAPVPIGSTVLVPAPFWQGFVWSLEQVPRLTCIPVDVIKPDRTFELTVDDLDKAYNEVIRKREPAPRLLVLTNPHNPLGVNYDPDLLKQIYDWALAKRPEMHIISDEMYCHSQLEGATPGFKSALQLTEGRNSSECERVHVVWGFAKDFGLSGFRAGFLISKSPYVKNAMLGSSDPFERRHPLPWFSAFDSLKHFYIERLLNKGAKFWDDTMNGYKQDLTRYFNTFTGVLNDCKYKIPFVHLEGSNSAQFIWLDLHDWLDCSSTYDEGESNLLFTGPYDYDAEQKLAANLLDHTNVKLLTGGTMYCARPGFFRLCFTVYPIDDASPEKVRESEIVRAVEKMCCYLRELKPLKPIPPTTS